MAQFLALAGFMGSGKSSIGRAVASRLGWRFVDLDQEFERTSAATIGAFFQQKGEQAFRAQECAVLGSVVGGSEASDGLVVALGGGTLENPKSRDLLRGRGGLMLLRVDSEEAWGRVQGSDRPLAQEKDAFEELWRKRQATYEAAADWVIPVERRDVDVLAGEICEIVETAGIEWPALWGRRLMATARPSLVVGGKDALRFLGVRATRVRGSGAALHVVSDRNVMKAWGEHVMSLLGGEAAEGAFVLEPGGGSKSTAVLGRCWEWLASRKARRDDVVVALGGGVVGDLAGFAAATYLRGVSLWQVPTSLLAQVDSSVGGKTAVNLEAGKNLVGAFYQPDLVVIDPATLATLPSAEYAGGLGEVVKHALLTSEEAVASLEKEAKAIRERDVDVVERVVKRNVSVKAAVVEEDEREAGRRAILNLGHTTAHAIEKSIGYGAIGHGQAVALGQLVALAVSERVLGLDPRVRERVRALLGELGLESSAELPAAEVLIKAAEHDKKVRSDSSGFVGLRAVGEPVWGVDVPAEVLISAVEVIRR